MHSSDLVSPEIVRLLIVGLAAALILAVLGVTTLLGPRRDASRDPFEGGFQ